MQFNSGFKGLMAMSHVTTTSQSTTTTLLYHTTKTSDHRNYGHLSIIKTACNSPQWSQSLD